MSPASSLSSDKPAATVLAPPTLESKENKVPGSGTTPTGKGRASSKSASSSLKEKLKDKIKEKVQGNLTGKPGKKGGKRQLSSSTVTATPPQLVSESESPPLDEPTIEKAVERMKAAANTANAAAAKAKAKNAGNLSLASNLNSSPNKTKPILSKANAIMIPNKKKPCKRKKGKNSSSSLDELPVLSPQTVLTPPDEEDEENMNLNNLDKDLKPSLKQLNSSQPSTPSTPGTASTPTTTPAKKGFRRNKFKSGFDYIRKKKKIITNPDGSPVVPAPKKVKVIFDFFAKTSKT